MNAVHGKPVSDEALKEIERKLARLLEEAQAKEAAAREAVAAAAAIQQDYQDLRRLAAKYNLQFGGGGSAAPASGAQSETGPSVGWLINQYTNHEQSPLPNINFHTRQSYENLLKRLDRER